MKKFHSILCLMLAGCSTITNAEPSPSTSVSGKYSVHCYFGGEVVLTSEAKRATNSNGIWKILDIDGSVYETNAMCIVKTN